MADWRISDFNAGTPPYDPASLALISVPAATPSGYASRKALLSDLTPGGRPEVDYALAPWAVDLDFVKGIYWNAPNNPPNSFTVTRASVGYVNNSSGVWTQVAANVLRGYPYTDLGTLIEKAKTNSVRNNSMQGAVAGTPGTLPTNWFYGGSVPNAISKQVVGTGTENGIDYIDIRFFGTPSGSGSFNLFFEGLTQIAAVAGQTWTASFFVTLQAGTLTNLGTLVIGVNEWTSGGAFVTGTNSALTVAAGALGLSRQSVTRTLTGGTTAAVDLDFGFQLTSGQAIDVTVRLGWPQLEQGTWASSPIRTTSAAATRADDVVSLTLPPSFGTSYSVAAAGTPQAPFDYNTPQNLVAVSDGTTTNRLALIRRASTGIPAFALDSSVTNIGAAAWSQNAAGTVAVAYGPSSQTASFNGTTTVAGTDPTAPTGLNTVQIGANGAAIDWWNGYITRILIWPVTRIGDQALVDIATTLPTANGYVTSLNYGTTTNDDALAGHVGEHQVSVVASGSAVALTTGTPANITNLSLTAGDWDVAGEVWFNPNASTVITQSIAAINTTSGTLPTDPGTGVALARQSGTEVTGVAGVVSVGPCRISIASTTTVYLVAQSAFTVSTNAAYGKLRARRMR